MLYRIAICDDDREFGADLEQSITQILCERKVEFSIRHYGSGEELLQALNDEEPAPQMIFLDVLMDGLNGVDTAKQIRRKDGQVSVVFITSTDQYVFSGYEVHALQYLLKPVDVGKLAQILEYDLKRRFDRNYFTFEIRQTTYQVPYDEILYAESELKATRLITRNETYRLPLQISDLEARLPARQFCRCHRCFIVNVGRIAEINAKGILLHQGFRVPIGKIYADQIRRAFLSAISAGL